MVFGPANELKRAVQRLGFPGVKKAGMLWFCFFALDERFQMTIVPQLTGDITDDIFPGAETVCTSGHKPLTLNVRRFALST